jgi:WD40 repeat protein
MPALQLTLRYRRSCARSEILAVGVSDGPAPAAYAIYPMAQTSQSWVDVFDLHTQRAQSMMSGTHAVFSPHGDRIATLRDSTVKLNGGVEYHYGSTVVIKDVATGKTLAELKDAHAPPLAWSRDGEMLAASEGTGPGVGRVGVWDVSSGTRAGRVMSHIDTVTHASFTPEHNLVTLSRDGTARLTNVRAAKTISRLEVGAGTGGNPRTLAVTPDGSTVASVWGTAVQVWLPRGSHITSYSLNSVRATEGWPLGISPDGRYMVCRTEDGFDIMDVASGAISCEHKTSVLVTAGAFSSDSKVLLLGTIDGNIEVWDLSKEMEKP